MKTILIIEDDIVFSRSISNWLVKKGMKTECVATLANARKAIGQKEFDLLHSSVHGYSPARDIPAVPPLPAGQSHETIYGPWRK